MSQLLIAWGNSVGTVVRVLTSHQCGLGLILAWCLMWVEFVVGFPVGTSQSVFLASEKLTFPNSNLIRIEEPQENQLRLVASFLKNY